MPLAVSHGDRTFVARTCVPLYSSLGERHFSYRGIAIKVVCWVTSLVVAVDQLVARENGKPVTESASSVSSS